ncbi:hypothetical protein JW877_03255 [bacterium]|nr:hypothetical protein [bacterium]
MKYTKIILYLCLLIFLIGVQLLYADITFLPLGRSWAGNAELPLPLGVGITYYHQEQDYHISKLTLNEEPLSQETLDTLGVFNISTEWNFLLDAWVLPFFNVFGIMGKVWGVTEVDINEMEGMDIDLDNIQNIEYDGWMYGGGGTLAGGGGIFFGSVTATITKTNLDVATSSVRAWVMAPKAGVVVENLSFFNSVNLWLGAMYQNSEESHQGHVEVPLFGELEYKVKLHQEEPWSYQLGLVAELSKRVILAMEGGMGGRKQLSATLQYRF